MADEGYSDGDGDRMTIGAAREAFVLHLSDVFAELVAIVKSPDWSNPDYPPYKEAYREMEAAFKRIAALNILAQKLQP